MQTLLDILASGIHDAKNQLFQAEARLVAAEAQHGIDLGEARYAIEAAAQRLSRTLTAYRLGRHEQAIAVTPTAVRDLIDEVALTQQPHLTSAGKTLSVDCAVDDAWPLDRDLLTDILNNAVQNAGRSANQHIRLSAELQDGGLRITVDDDGPGFSALPPPTGTGLTLADTLAGLHRRKDRQGKLTLSNDSPLGGARFALWLP